jgi:hypothetical protein
LAGQPNTGSGSSIPGNALLWDDGPTDALLWDDGPTDYLIWE